MTKDEKTQMTECVAKGVCLGMNIYENIKNNKENLVNVLIRQKEVDPLIIYSIDEMKIEIEKIFKK